MILRTHLAIGGAVCLFFLPHVDNKLIFISVLLIASAIPDIDTGFSTIGSKGIFRILQFFVRHRGVVHSFTTALVLSCLFALYLPMLALPFFLGYSFHLLADSFTVDGVKLFWPFGPESKGKIKTGGRIEDGIFLAFLLVDVVLLMSLFL